jgi:hypothetical protein
MSKRHRLDMQNIRSIKEVKYNFNICGLDSGRISMLSLAILFPSFKIKKNSNSNLNLVNSNFPRQKRWVWAATHGYKLYCHT